MTTHARRLTALAAVAVLAGALGGACSSAEQPTPIFVIVTASPQPTDTPTPTPAPTETAGPSESASASPSATAAPTATPVPGGGLVGVEYCTGSQTIKDFFTLVANNPKVTFAVYCGKMPSGWGVQPPSGLNYGTPSAGAWLTGVYVKSGGAMITLKEGKYLGGDICSASSTGTLGTASFASMSGELHSIPGGFAICLNPGSKSAYEISGTGVNQSTFTSIAANLVLVPKT